ncbi:hypothetical protein DY000_02003861 [Brassica cretica]|uniref:Uncharacterized protein n=1 Tax=Brassica cretica TaxID=69181 RepID=A0ABQ7CLZ2_BRACR|nr:hypothetical protein DY000_02003861 [Brassica cretica]
MRMLTTAVNTLLKRENSLLQRHGFAHVVAQRTNSVHQTETKVPKIPPFSYSPPPYDGPSTGEIIAKRREFLSPALFHFYNTPVQNKGPFSFPLKRRRFHPEVVESVIKQLKLIQHSTTLYLNHTISDFAEALVSTLPGDLKVVFFTNSGTEANELAMMMARLYTGCNDVVSLRNSYHGNAAATMGATAQSNWKFNVVQSGVHHAINPDPYRGIFGSDGEKYARDVHDLIQFGTSGQGVGGIVELAPGYLPAAYDIVRRAGGVCIADEVQSGFARTGTHFWGFQSHDVIPDIVTMAKGIGNGIPLGAVVTTPEIAGVLSRRFYFNTFGGNPMCTAAGHAVLRVIQEEKLQENAFLVGSHLKRRLTQLKDKYELIGDARGRGLMLGVEFVTDRDLKTPAKLETLHLMDQMKEMGVLVGKGGFYGNVFRITPPLCFTLHDADFLVDVMDHALSKM